MRALLGFLAVVVVLALIVAIASIGIYNSLQGKDEQVTGAWSEVVNQYQRRADLIPNLVKTVKSYAAHEREVLTGVAEARANAGKIDMRAALESPQAFAQVEQAQQALGGALSRLLAVSERYPELKADGTYRDLMAQLEGTENRITVARNRYIQTVQSYNISVRRLPGAFIARLIGMERKPNFTVENESAVSKAPEIDL